MIFEYRFVHTWIHVYLTLYPVSGLQHAIHDSHTQNIVVNLIVYCIDVVDNIIRKLIIASVFMIHNDDNQCAPNEPKKRNIESRILAV